ncbi:MAG: LacI family DNA-binding transcriptional regulator, partial [Nocardioidaceae bacterium]
MPHTASVKDVAAAAGVSLGTVSNVLNRPERVSARTRTRVEEAMHTLGFIRNESARQLRVGMSHTLAYVMLDATNPFFTDVAEGIEVAAEHAQLSLFLCNSNNRASRERAYLEHLQQQRVQGILITPVNPEDPHLTQVAAAGTPVVVVDRVSEHGDLCCVAVDDHLGGALAVEHLIEQGHERVAFIGGPASIGQVRDRHEGARSTWLAAGLPEERLTSIATDALTVESGLEAGGRLAGIPRSRRPTAAFCANDLIALGLLQHAISNGADVPDDLAIVGYDDIVFAGAAAVPLTSVSQPRHEL